MADLKAWTHGVRKANWRTAYISLKLVYTIYCFTENLEEYIYMLFTNTVIHNTALIFTFVVVSQYLSIMVNYFPDFVLFH